MAVAEDRANPRPARYGRHAARPVSREANPEVAAGLTAAGYHPIAA